MEDNKQMNITIALMMIKLHNTTHNAAPVLGIITIMYQNMYYRDPTYAVPLYCCEEACLLVHGMPGPSSSWSSGQVLSSPSLFLKKPVRHLHSGAAAWSVAV